MASKSSGPSRSRNWYIACPPRPEVVAGRPITVLGQPGHRALEGVAVQVRQSGDRDPVTLIARGGIGAGFDASDDAVGQGQPDGGGPPPGQQRG